MTIETVEQLREFVEKPSYFSYNANDPAQKLLIERLTEAFQALTFALGEIDRLSKRLEIDTEFPNIDGIFCRNQTIKLQDEKLNELQAELDRIKNVDVKYLQTQIIFGCDCTKPAIAREVAQAVKDFIIKGE